jgi:DNA-directed RNA polymerase specialized sigma24 family protein
MIDRERLLDDLRPVAFAIAYRMLGSVSEAEDVVQEALLRVHQALEFGEQIASPRAFVATVTSGAAASRCVRLRVSGDRRDRRQERGQRAPDRHPRQTSRRAAPAPLDKLKHLGPVADFATLLRSAR